MLAKAGIQKRPERTGFSPRRVAEETRLRGMTKKLLIPLFQHPANELISNGFKDSRPVPHSGEFAEERRKRGGRGFLGGE